MLVIYRGDKPALQLFMYECPTFKCKDQCCEPAKGGNVEPIRDCSEYIVAGKYQHRDQNQTYQVSRKLDTPVGCFLLCYYCKGGLLSGKKEKKLVAIWHKNEMEIVKNDK